MLVAASGYQGTNGDKTHRPGDKFAAESPNPEGGWKLLADRTVHRPRDSRLLWGLLRPVLLRVFLFSPFENLPSLPALHALTSRLVGHRSLIPPPNAFAAVRPQVVTLRWSWESTGEDLAHVLFDFMIP